MSLLLVMLGLIEPVWAEFEVLPDGRPLIISYAASEAGDFSDEWNTEVVGSQVTLRPLSFFHVPNSVRLYGETNFWIQYENAAVQYHVEMVLDYRFPLIGVDQRALLEAAYEERFAGPLREASLKHVKLQIARNGIVRTRFGDEEPLVVPEDYVISYARQRLVRLSPKRIQLAPAHHQEDELHSELRFQVGLKRFYLPIVVSENERNGEVFVEDLERVFEARFETPLAHAEADERRVDLLMGRQGFQRGSRSIRLR